MYEKAIFNELFENGSICFENGTTIPQNVEFL